MMRFEDLEVWKRSARLSADIYKEFKDLKDFSFRDQLTRSGVSIPSNIDSSDIQLDHLWIDTRLPHPKKTAQRVDLAYVPLRLQDAQAPYYLCHH